MVKELYFLNTKLSKSKSHSIFFTRIFMKHYLQLDNWICVNLIQYKTGEIIRLDTDKFLISKAYIVIIEISLLDYLFCVEI